MTSKQHTQTTTPSHLLCSAGLSSCLASPCFGGGAPSRKHPARTPLFAASVLINYRNPPPLRLFNHAGDQQQNALPQQQQQHDKVCMHACVSGPLWVARVLTQ